MVLDGDPLGFTILVSGFRVEGSGFRAYRFVFWALGQRSGFRGSTRWFCCQPKHMDVRRFRTLQGAHFQMMTRSLRDLMRGGLHSRKPQPMQHFSNLALYVVSCIKLFCICYRPPFVT